jgi:hypothetical protein
MPLPPPDPPLVQQHPVAVCTCHHPQHQQRADINPYENYDVPKSLLGPSYPRVSLLLWTYLTYFDLNFSYRIDLAFVYIINDAGYIANGYSSSNY